MEIVSLIVSIIGTLFSVCGVVLGIIFWKYSYEYHKNIKRLKIFDFSKEYSFQEYSILVDDILEEHPEKEYKYEKEMSTLDEIKWVMFNFYKNIKRK
jgi:hypothetical protein